MGVAEFSQQGRFAGIREAYESDIGNEFQDQAKVFGFTFLALCIFQGSLVGGRFPVAISQAAFPAGCRHKF